MPTARTRKAEAASRDGDGLVVTAQQSRFHELDDSALKDIDISDISITIGRREILQHARLVLKSGLRYVFVGRNGLGKSTVLKALAERRIPGIAPNIRILLLDQTTIERSKPNTTDSSSTERDRSVLEHVVAQDRDRQRLLDDSASLSTVLQGGDADTHHVSQVHRRLRLEQAKRDLDAARLVAEHRSGARGSKARQVVLQREADVEAAELAYKEHSTSSDGDADVQAATTMLESMQIELDAMGSSTIESRARSVLIGLGFSSDQIDGSMNKLSGGWQTRAALAAALVQRTDILLLDEPTNFLDLPAIIWLQHYLVEELAVDTTLVVTTHDRDFADAVAERLLILRINPPCSLDTFNGTLSDHYGELRRQIKRMTKMSENLEKSKEHMQSTIQKSVAAAKRTGDDKKLKQAASRKKKLDERMGMEVSAKGTRFKLNRDMPGWHTSSRAGIDIPEFDPPVSMNIADQPPELRNVGSLVSFEGVSFTYKGSKQPTLNDLNLIIHPGARAGLVGLNGSGKSTLVNTITSDFSSPSSSPGKMTGTLIKHSQARIAHYTQHETSRLLAFGKAHPDLSALSYLQQLHPSIPEPSLRATLSGLSLSAAAQAQTPLAALSGGQLVRVGLAEVLLPLPPHLLILDEPTTHLDADSIIALIKALKHYKGALLVISHDRFFIRCVVEGQSVNRASSTEDDQDDDAMSDSDTDDDGSETGRVYRLTRTSGRMIPLPRGMDEYEEVVMRQLAKKGIEV